MRTRTTSALGLAGVLLAVPGAAVIGHGMSRLRWAYLYRERSTEGIGFFQVGLELVVGGVIALAAVGLLFVAVCPAKASFRRIYAGVAVTLVLGLAACAFAAFWVEGGSGCIGPCGPTEPAALPAHYVKASSAT